MKTTPRNTSTSETEILGSHIERHQDKLFMVTDIRTTTRTYDGRGFAGSHEQYQTLRLPLSQVENLHLSQTSTMTYYLNGGATADGDTLQEVGEPHLSIRSFTDKGLIERFYSWNEARQYVTWANRLGTDTTLWALYRDDDLDHPVDFLRLEQDR